MSSICPSDRPELTRAERRAFPRVEFDCPARWSTGGADRCGWARDASEAGAGFTVRSISAPQVGQSIQLSFELDPRLEWVVDENAIVERCDEQGNGLWEVGVRLGDLGMF